MKQFAIGYVRKFSAILSKLYCCYEEKPAPVNAPWHPMTDPVDIKHLGKLAEELNELGKEINRALIQGIDEINPKTGVTNRIHIQEEMAGVIANIELNEDHFGLHISPFRIGEKKNMLRDWHRNA